MTDESLPALPPPSEDDVLLKQCRIDTFTAGGKGGQHQNRTESGVRLVHLPSGVTVTSRSRRSQRRNLEAALAELRRRLQVLATPPRPRVKTRIPPAEKARRLEEKRQRASRKSMRKPPRDE